MGGEKHATAAETALGAHKVFGIRSTVQTIRRSIYIQSTAAVLFIVFYRWLRWYQKGGQHTASVCMLQNSGEQEDITHAKNMIAAPRPAAEKEKEGIAAHKFALCAPSTM